MSIRLSHIDHSYHSNKKEVPVLQDINLFVEDREICALIGPSGCGKSTLLRLIAGIGKSIHGEILINEEKINTKKQSIGFVPQHYGLLPWKSVLDNILLPHILHKYTISKELQE